MHPGDDIAIVIPAHDREATIASTLDSLSAQSHRHWQAIVVDDGSTDATARIARERARRDPRVTVLRNPVRLGASASRNRALQRGEARWTCFLDADDELTPVALQRLVARAGTGDCDAVHGATARIASDGVRVAMDRAPDRADLFEVFARAPAAPIHSVLVRTDAARAAGGFDPRLAACEDWDLWQRVSRAGARWAAVPDVVALYRMRVNSASQHAERMLTDGLGVIARGHRDPPPGSDPPGERSRRLASTYLACWTAGLAIAADGATDGLLATLGDGVCAEVEPDVCARLVFDAVAVGRAVAPTAWPRFDPDVLERCARFLGALGERTRDAAFARDGRSALTRRLLEQRPPPASSERWQTAVVALGERVGAVTAAPGVDRVICLVRDGDRELGRTELAPAQGVLPAFVVADAAAAAVAWPLLCDLLWASLADELVVRVAGSSALVHRGKQRLYEGPIDGTLPVARAVLDRVAWTLFLQELWECPDWELSRFYDPEAADPAAAQRALAEGEGEGDPIVVEIDGALAPVSAREPVRVAVRLGAVPVCLVEVSPVEGLVSAQRLRAAITQHAGFELGVAAVRSVLIGGGRPGAPLRELLRAAPAVPAVPAAPAGSVSEPRAPLVPGWGAVGDDGAAHSLLSAAAGAWPGDPTTRAGVLDGRLSPAIAALAQDTGAVLVTTGGGPIVRSPVAIPLTRPGPPVAARRRAPALRPRDRRPPGPATALGSAGDEDAASTGAPSALWTLVCRDPDAAQETLDRLARTDRRIVSVWEWRDAVRAHAPPPDVLVTVVLDIDPILLGRGIMRRLSAIGWRGTLMAGGEMTRDRRRGRALRKLMSRGLEIGWRADADLRDLTPDGLAARLLARRHELVGLCGPVPATVGFLDRSVDSGVTHMAAACGWSAGLVRSPYPARAGDDLRALPARLVAAGDPSRADWLRV